MGRPIVRLVVAAALAVAMAGCGGSGSGSGHHTGASAPATTTTAAGLSPGPSSPPVTSSSSASSSASPGSTVPLGDHGPQQFRLPSGNIGCFLDASNARCDIGQRDWVAPAKPDNCQVDYGNGLTLDTKGATVACAGDTVLGASTVLDYGQSAARGPFVCLSSQVGVTCRDTANGHGFDLSRQAYKLY